jgi:hypothetical protein
MSAVQCARQQAQARLTGTASTDPDAGRGEEPPGQTRPPDNIFIRAPAIVSPIKPPANPVSESKTFRTPPPTAESKRTRPKWALGNGRVQTSGSPAQLNEKDHSIPTAKPKVSPNGVSCSRNVEQQGTRSSRP